MDTATLVPFAILGGVTAGLWGLMQMFQQGDSRANERLDVLKNNGRDRKLKEKTGVAGLLERAAPALSSALQPKSEVEQNELKVRLANAGFSQPGAGEIYLAIKFTGLMVGAALGGGWGLVMYGFTQTGYTSIAFGAGIGFYLPEVVLWWIRGTRMQNIFLQLPDVLDLLVVCVEAGLGLDAGLRKVQEELNDTAPEICHELAVCNMQMQMGRTRRDVLHDFGIRTGVDDVKSLVAILIQAERFGSSVAQALRVQSDSMRTKRMQMAEEKAQKTAVQMLIPMVIFIFPGIFVVLVGPAAIKMVDQLMTK